MRPIALLLILAGCGRSETYPGVADVVSALDAGEPRCDRDGGVPLLMRTALPNGPAAHWGQLDACINVTYEVEVEPLLGDLRVALSDWTFPSCTWICFTAPIPQEDRPMQPNDRRLHLGLIKKSDQSPGAESARSALQIVDGEIINASMLVKEDRVAPGQAPLLTLVGQALGFVPTDGVDSVLNDRADVAFSLSKADEQSVCAAYPTCR